MIHFLQDFLSKMSETSTIARSAWPTLPSHHNASGMILRHNHPSHMIFMDVSSIRLGSQVAALSDGLVPDLIPGNQANDRRAQFWLKLSPINKLATIPANCTAFLYYSVQDPVLGGFSSFNRPTRRLWLHPQATEKIFRPFFFFLQMPCIDLQVAFQSGLFEAGIATNEPRALGTTICLKE